MLEQLNKFIRLRITGETAGTGATTVAKILADYFQTLRFDGGVYWRAFANQFRISSEESHQDPLEIYADFLEMYASIYDQDGIEGVLTHLEENYGGVVAGDEVLGAFHKLAEQYAIQTGNIDIFWDLLIEDFNAVTAAKAHSYIWESKLAVLALSFSRYQDLLAQTQQEFVIPALNVLLTVSPEVAASRVGARDSSDIEFQNIMERYLGDFQRYQRMYDIDGSQVTHESLREQVPPEDRIDTSERDPYEVTAIILITYKAMLEAHAASVPAILDALLAELDLAIEHMEQESKNYRNNGVKTWEKLDKPDRMGVLGEQLAIMQDVEKTPT